MSSGRTVAKAAVTCQHTSSDDALLFVLTFKLFLYRNHCFLWAPTERRSLQRQVGCQGSYCAIGQPNFPSQESFFLITAARRRLLEAAQRGAVEEAEEAMESMREAGLPPGPRATHSLLYAYVKRGDAAGALEVAQAAAADGA